MDLVCHIESSRHGDPQALFLPSSSLAAIQEHPTLVMSQAAEHCTMCSAVGLRMPAICREKWLVG